MVIIYYIIAIIGFLTLVLVHEFGHFIFAKLAKIKVVRFSIGWGKPIWEKQIGETTYQIGVFPFGGFCQMAGEQITDDYIPSEGDFYSKKPFSRLLAVAGGVLFSLLFGVLLMAIAGTIPSIETFVPPQIYITEDLQNQPAYQAGLRSLDIITEIDGKKIESFSDVQMIVGQAMGKKLSIKVLREGKELSFEIIPDVERSTGRSIIGIYQYLPPIIDMVIDNSVFSDLNLQKNDKLSYIIAENGEKIEVKSTADIPNFIEKHLYENLEFVFTKSDNNTVSKKVFVDKKFNLGISFYIETRKVNGLPFYKSLFLAFPKSYETLAITIKSIPLLFSGKVNVGQSVAGPIKIIYLSSQVAKTGIKNILEFFALITLVLGLTNLLPIPATDGSYILFFLFEMISRKRLNPKLISKIQSVGFFLLIILMIIVVLNDIFSISSLL
ncbi:MAG: RIP metalloprotease RseP [Spirochaetota bacterium]